MNSSCTYTCTELRKEICIEHKSSFSFDRRLWSNILITSLLSLLFWSLFVVASFGQTDFYNADFEKLTDLNDIKAFVSDMKEHCNADRYRIDKTPVVEYYDKEDNSFKGLSLDTNMKSYDRINIIKKDKSLKKFIKTHGLQLGSALYFKRPFEGMNQGQLKLIAGEPDKIKYSIEGESQVIHFKYADGRVYSFKDGKMMKILSTSSKTPIALEQP